MFVEVVVVMAVPPVKVWWEFMCVCTSRCFVRGVWGVGALQVRVHATGAVIPVVAFVGSLVALLPFIKRSVASAASTRAVPGSLALWPGCVRWVGACVCLVVLHSSAEAQHKVQGGFFLNVVICKGAFIFQLLASE